MSDNPFQSPETVSAPVPAELVDGARRRSAEDLLVIANAQRWVMFAILGYFGAIAFRFAGPGVAPLSLAFAAFAILTGIVGVVRLAARIYRSWLVGVLNGLALFLPLIGLFVLLILNGRATRLLRKYGIRVGLIGANSNDLQQLRSATSGPTGFPRLPGDR